ncbi:MAG: hypothetical protein Q8L47_00705 [bacterium]|nr:hypothetical protein [bacterium]
MSLLYKIFNIPRTQEEAIDKANRNEQKVIIGTDFKALAGCIALGFEYEYEASTVVQVGDKKYIKKFSASYFMPLGKESTDELRKSAEERANSLRRLVA